MSRHQTKNRSHEQWEKDSPYKILSLLLSVFCNFPFLHTLPPRPPLSGRTANFGSFFTCQKCPAGLSPLTTSLPGHPQTCIPLLFQPLCKTNHTEEMQLREPHLPQLLYFHVLSKPGSVSLALPLLQYLQYYLLSKLWCPFFLLMTPLTLTGICSLPSCPITPVPPFPRLPLCPEAPTDPLAPASH